MADAIPGVTPGVWPGALPGTWLDGRPEVIPGSDIDVPQHFRGVDGDHYRILIEHVSDVRGVRRLAPRHALRGVARAVGNGVVDRDVPAHHIDVVPREVVP